jgi:hypothetical protein
LTQLRHFVEKLTLDFTQLIEISRTFEYTTCKLTLK